MSSTQVYAKLYGFANNTWALHGVRFATDVEDWTAVQKALRAIPAEEFEKIRTPKWQECIINCEKYYKCLLTEMLLILTKI